MNKREEALKEALLKNEEESHRWQNYLTENETAIENMATFGKRLSIDVMVPVGKKAFMPGHLIHTNEVLVGHYQGYFSKCTSSKAKEVCELRIKTAREHLVMLKTEADLWQNKLDKPYTEGVMASGEEREIIEDFNEENEKLWKSKHKISLKRAKQQEHEEREKLNEKLKDNTSSKEKTDAEIMKMLEEAELMEELEQELDNLEVDEVNDETIRRLMSGEMKLPKEKKRSAYEETNNKMEKGEESILVSNVVKKNDIKKNESNTNNNTQPNMEIMNLLNTEEQNETEVEEPIPEEVALIKEQAKFLNAEDQIGFYDYQIQIIRQKLQLLPLRTQQDLDEKVRLLNVLENLEELLELAEETVGAEELAEKDLENESEIDENIVIPQNDDILENDTAKKSKQKRRISFALDDQTLEFRKHEAVTQMLPPKTDKPKRDIIKLDDDDIVQKDDDLNEKLESLDKKDLIKSKVEKNLQFVSENQSKQDFDLVQQILESSLGVTKTLHIKFKHSQQEPTLRDNNKTSDIPGSPADFYDSYEKSLKSSETEPSTLFINSYEGEDKVRAPMLKEADREAAFADPKSEFSNPSLQSKSILKNKSAVDKENHFKANQSSKTGKSKKSTKKSNKNDEDECLSAYYKVMNEVVEKPITQPEPLPDVKFIDAHTPKKRISHFKQMRQGKEKT